MFYLYLIYFLIVHQTGFSEELDAVICQRRSSELECKNDEVLFIDHAWYGRTDDRCGAGNSTNCINSSAIHLIKNNCECKIRCRIQASNEIFGNPCPGEGKFLYTRYRCINSEACIEKTRDTTVTASRSMATTNVMSTTSAVANTTLQFRTTSGVKTTNIPVTYESSPKLKTTMSLANADSFVSTITPTNTIFLNTETNLHAREQNTLTTTWIIVLVVIIIFVVALLSILSYVCLKKRNLKKAGKGKNDSKQAEGSNSTISFQTTSNLNDDEARLYEEVSHNQEMVSNVIYEPSTTSSEEELQNPRAYNKLFSREKDKTNEKTINKYNHLDLSNHRTTTENNPGKQKVYNELYVPKELADAEANDAKLRTHSNFELATETNKPVAAYNQLYVQESKVDPNAKDQKAFYNKLNISKQRAHTKY